MLQDVASSQALRLGQKLLGTKPPAQSPVGLRPSLEVVSLWQLGQAAQYPGILVQRILGSIVWPKNTVCTSITFALISQ